MIYPVEAHREYTDNMRKKMYIFLLSLLVFSTDAALGNGSNKTKPSKPVHNKHNGIKIHSKTNNDRLKRSLVNEVEHPFWATRGRRDSSSAENYVDSTNDKNCENCYTPNGYSDIIYGNLKHIREDIKSPFWGNRGRRSEEIDDDDSSGGLFWGSRGRRLENEPFWGSKGRRQEDSPFWGQRGRREEDPFWGNRGRRHEEPFWGNRGRRENGEPFWGNRGRREESEPFWGNRGRRENYELFWDSRGRKKETDPFWSSRGRRKQDIKASILKAISDVENDIENLSRLRRSNDDPNSFLPTKPRESIPKHSSNIPDRPRILQSQKFFKSSFLSDTKSPEPGTMLDNNMYVDEPGYILVERLSRSSAEEDPFYITRGKKYYINYDMGKAARDRRGAIEEIVKSVRNDPFYIARGKKDDKTKIENSTRTYDKLSKVKELICATIDLVMKKERMKVKRDLSDSERERRTTLKKLAAQLQMDPYFVSRGKKSDVPSNDDSFEGFISAVASKCN